MKLENGTLISARSSSSYIQDDYLVEDPWRPAAPNKKKNWKLATLK